MDAIEFARNYVGNMDFMRAMRDRVTRGQVLSQPMVDAIGRCENRARPVAVGPLVPLAADSPIDLSPLPKGTTRYAVRNSEGKLSFLRIDRPNKPTSSWVGFSFVKVISGPSEERIGIQRPGRMYEGKMVGLLGKVLHNPNAAMARYGQEIGECGKCGRRLTDDTSRSLGIGPECRKGMA